MASPTQTFESILRQAGYSITRPRRAVFDVLLGKEPLAMRDIVALVPHIDRASVYRVIELFEVVGIVQRLHTGWKYKIELTDTFTPHHHHMTCVRCGSTIAMGEDELEALIDDLAARHHFTATAHQIEIQGVCASCSQAQAQN